MPHWEILIIPLIALGVWILGTLFKGEEEKLKARGRQAGGPGRTPRRPVTDLDRFLEDARRRREMEERAKKSAPPRPPTPTRQAPPSRPAPARVPLSERPSRLLDTPPRPVPSARPAEEPPLVIPVARPVPKPATIREAAVEAALAVPLPQPVPDVPPAPATPATTRETRRSPISQQVHALLRKPQTAAAAFVLREIFDRPLCMRRRR
jgi:hypothetical protein